MKGRIFLIFVVIASLLSCKKDSFITSGDATIRFSADTLSYDTVFVTAGSITQSFKIFNNNNQKLLLSSVRIAGGASSAYFINVDGTPGPEVNNLEIDANDSLYVFVKVNINSSAANLPFLVKDSIQVTYNGINRFVQLVAYGRNAHFMKNKLIRTDTTWSNDLPYVITGSFRIDTGKTLTIQPGCRIYVNARAPFIVDGSLQVNGTQSDSVVFAGDRIDPYYRDLPGSWPGLYFRGMSKDNRLTHTIINNSYQAIVAEKPSVNSNPKISLYETVINNTYDAGILALNSSVYARNCLISNCGYNIQLVMGGTYQFDFCTAASFFNNYLFRKSDNRVLTLINSDGAPTSQIFNLDASFRNCIFWGVGGAVEDEVAVFKQGNPTLYSVNFINCAYKVTNDITNASVVNSLKNQDPAFDSVDVLNNYYNLRLKSSSPLINKGVAVPGISNDLDGHPRILGPQPDMGCYEKQ